MIYVESYTICFSLSGKHHSNLPLTTAGVSQMRMPHRVLTDSAPVKQTEVALLNKQQTAGAQNKYCHVTTNSSQQQACL